MSNNYRFGFREASQARANASQRRKVSRWFIGAVALIGAAVTIAVIVVITSQPRPAHGERRESYTALMPQVMQPVRPVESSTGVVTRTVEVK